VFFKAWFGIIVFGMSNGFILLPVLLSYVGPTLDVGHSTSDDEVAENKSKQVKDKLNDTKVLAKVEMEMPTIVAPVNGRETICESGNAPNSSLDPAPEINKVEFEE
jgi:hypothetical protein